MKAHLLVEQLRAGTYGAFYSSPVKPAPSIAERITLAHKFEAQYGGLLDDQVLHQTAVALWRAGILKLPYREIWVEIASERGTTNGMLCFMAAATEPDTQRVLFGQEQLVISPFFYRDGIWKHVGSHAIANPQLTPPERIELNDDLGYNAEDRKLVSDFCGYGLINVIDLLCFLSTKHAVVSKVDVPARLNRARARDGRAQLYEYHVVRLDPSTVERGEGDGTHASPRLHWRRGHVRTLSTGNKVAVQPCLVGVADRGFIDKDYQVKAPKRDGGPS